MSDIIGIDPGVNTVAWSRVQNNRLIACGLIEAAFPLNVISFMDKQEWQMVLPVLHVEKPQVYDVSKQKGDQKDIVNLAITVGALAGCWASKGGVFVLFEPREWKGQVPKDIMLSRIVDKLMEEEVAIIPKLPKSKLHNVIDAVGIGLWACGRLGKAKRDNHD